jgi:hypothetical protein
MNGNYQIHSIITVYRQRRLPRALFLPRKVHIMMLMLEYGRWTNKVWCHVWASLSCVILADFVSWKKSRPPCPTLISALPSNSQSTLHTMFTYIMYCTYIYPCSIIWWFCCPRERIHSSWLNQAHTTFSHIFATLSTATVVVSINNPNK